ncbi:MAG: TIGR02587 family membrane protein [Coleofasciculus sp. G3-WIS-01]|uniref:TIGR02587 family membrane protein n=1 Tax=Coleofasciculus sp. G3-WIS-01 TaxID=3069528 RepID=UPI0032FDFCD0
MVKLLQTQQHSQACLLEIHQIIRGVFGGFLFGIPLLYTMEVWWIGSYIEPIILLGVLIITYLVVFLFNRSEGFRKNRRDGIVHAAIESVEALAIGIVCATVILILLRRITGETPIDEALGKVIFESVPFSLGVAMARSLLPEQSAESDSSQYLQPIKKLGFRDMIADISATLIGAIIVAFSIAPTDEIPTLAAAASPPWLLVIIAASLLISYGIVFAAGFAHQRPRRLQKGILPTPIGKTILSYLISLLASALMLWFFNRLSLSDPWFLWLRYTLLLGLPATIGGAAGRLAI